MRAKRKLKRTIFIACEGRNTERIYFEAMGEDAAVSDEFAITVYPDENTEDPTTHALGLVREAQKKIEDFDEVWAVFDKDGYTKHAETFAEAGKVVCGKKVNIAFSSIAFEQWILLHFDRSEAAYAKSADIITQLIHSNYFPGYSKTAYQETYSIVKDKTTIALENAAWLRHRLYQQGALPDTAIHAINPYTDADVLVKRLLGISEEILWVSHGQEIAFGHLSFQAILGTNQTVTVSLQNNGQDAIVFNAGNINAHFYILNAAREKIYCTNPATTVIAPGEDVIYILSFDLTVNGMLLNFLYGQYRVMMKLP